MQVNFAAKNVKPVVTTVENSSGVYYGAGVATIAGLSLLGFALYNIKKQKKVEEPDEFEQLI